MIGNASVSILIFNNGIIFCSGSKALVKPSTLHNISPLALRDLLRRFRLDRDNYLLRLRIKIMHYPMAEDELQFQSNFKTKMLFRWYAFLLIESMRIFGVLHHNHSVTPWCVTSKHILWKYLTPLQFWLCSWLLWAPALPLQESLKPEWALEFSLLLRWLL